MKFFYQRLLFLLCVCVFFSAMIYAGGGIENTIEKTFQVGSGGTLTLDTERGSIQILSGDQDFVSVKIVLRADTRNQDKASDLFDDFKTEFHQKGKNVDIRASYKGGGWSFWNFGKTRLNARFVISVPLDYNVDLKTSGGSISVDELHGDVHCRTSGGSLKFGPIRGSVHGRTSGGSITLKGCKGPVNIETSGGSITIGKAMGPVDAHTSGGSVTVEEVLGKINASTSGGSMKATISRQPEDNCRLTTSGGSITVVLARGIGVDADARTSGGKVYTDFPVDGEKTKKSLKSRINGGGPLLYLRTSGGSVYIKEK